MHALVATLSAYPTIELHLDHRCVSIEQYSLSDGITATFSNASAHTGSLLLGCDGVHSFTRNSHVDPDRKQICTGVANAFGFLPLTDEDRARAHFEVSALNFAPKGLLLTSYHEETRREGYVGAIITAEDVGSREGWKAKGEDAEGVKHDMLERFAGMDTRLPIVSDWLLRVEEWFMSARSTPSNRRRMLTSPAGGQSTWCRVAALDDGVMDEQCCLVMQHTLCHHKVRALALFLKTAFSSPDVYGQNWQTTTQLSHGTAAE
jgi:2-polyprenyl-6-methoxyphenol hydroxylase-like FAD-dependent oxidoreductase